MQTLILENWVFLYSKIFHRMAGVSNFQLVLLLYISVITVFYILRMQLCDLPVDFSKSGNSLFCCLGRGEKGGGDLTLKDGNLFKLLQL